MCLRSPARHRGARVCIQTLSNALCLLLLLSSGEPPHISLQNETMWGISQQLFPRGWNMSLTNITHKIACFLAIFLAKYLSAALPGGYLRPCCFVLTMSCFRTSKAPPVLSSSTSTVPPFISSWVYLLLCQALVFLAEFLSLQRLHTPDSHPAVQLCIWTGSECKWAVCLDYLSFDKPWTRWKISITNKPNSYLQMHFFFFFLD